MEGVDSKIGKMGFKKHSMLAPGWLRGLSFCLWLRLWSQGPGTEPHIGLSAWFSAPPPTLPACLLVISVK